MSSSTSSLDFQICTACGTQFSTPSSLLSCRICNDPRQFVPPTGQSFTTLSTLRSSSTKYKNTRTPLPHDPRFISISTTPKFAIGQRCILIKTTTGNILWDCIAYLDDDTISWIKDQGGLKAIVISHPHYYTTHLEWAQAFECPVYLSHEDKSWLSRHDSGHQRFIPPQLPKFDIQINSKPSGVRVLKLGGHFPGSLVCLYEKRLLVADTLVTTPSGMGDWVITGQERPEGMNSFAFMWSIPNMIPLGPEEIWGMWKVLKGERYVSSHGAFVGTEIWDEGRMERRVLESMKIQIRGIGWGSHGFLGEEVE